MRIDDLVNERDRYRSAFQELELEDHDVKYWRERCEKAMEGRDYYRRRHGELKLGRNKWRDEAKNLRISRDRWKLKCSAFEADIKGLKNELRTFIGDVRYWRDRRKAA